MGLAALRDAAAAFKTRSDLPVRGRSAYVFGDSQSGRLLRTFLYEGFNVTEHDQRAFDAVWSHIAGAARGSFNERFAIPVHGDMYRSTKFPFSEAEQTDTDGRRAALESRLRAEQRPKVFYTNTAVEYWGGGRAAALTHTTLDGRRDLVLPDNVRIYVLAGAQHLEPRFPPPPLPTEASERTAWSENAGQQLVNPTPHANVMRALLRAWHQWASQDTVPPSSQYPRLSDNSLSNVPNLKFPALPRVADPRSIAGPARVVDGKVVPLPFLVPQVDRDGNDLGGIRVPELTVPLATTTGWNLRSPIVGNPTELYAILGSYVPFAPTKALRMAVRDPRLSIEERYRGVDDYMQRVRSAANRLIRDRYLLAEDLDDVVARARVHWDYATASQNKGGTSRSANTPLRPETVSNHSCAAGHFDRRAPARCE